MGWTVPDALRWAVIDYKTGRILGRTKTFARAASKAPASADIVDIHQREIVLPNENGEPIATSPIFIQNGE